MDGYLPLNALHDGATRDRLFGDRTARWLTVLGRMRPDVDIAEAQAAAAVAARQMERQYPDANAGIGVRVIPEPRARPEPAGLMGDAERSDRPAEVLLLSLAALVLLLACVNVANLLFVRATARQRELAVRAAVGASRGRLVRQALAETAALALLGAAAGLVLGTLASRALERAIALPAYFSVSLDFGLHWRVFAYTFIAATVTVILCGIWPARRASSAHAGAALRDGGRQTSGGPAHQRLRSLLAAGQIAGSFVLLIVAALFVRDLRRTAQLDLGFEPDGLVNVWMDPQWAGYDEPRTEHFYEDLERRVRALPGVESVSMAFSIPMGYYRSSNAVSVDGRLPPPGEQPPGVSRNYVGVSYFDTMQIPIVSGRAFSAADDEHAPAVAIINEAMARRFWPNQEPVGSRFRGDGPGSPWLEVVGVARDSKYVTLWEDPQPYFYKPLAQQYVSMRWLHVRSALAPERLRASIEEEIRAAGPDVPTDVQTMEQVLSGYGGFMIMRIAVIQAGAMGLLGLFLAIVGIYGVISYGAVRRTKEIGVRVALGARPADVRRLVIGQGAFLIAGGLLAGFGAAVGVSRLLAGIVGMADATDPWVFTLVTLLLATTALVASYLPARQALRVPPTVALRQE
jgi:predicted permease